MIYPFEGGMEELRERLKRAAERNQAEGLLFSGGLDTSVLAAISPEMIGIHVSLEEFGSDIEYAKRVEEFLHLKVYYQKIKIEDAVQSIPEVIRILKSFDPAIPNDLAVYFGLKFAKQIGLKSLMTGDGSDELFAGYEYMQGINKLDRYLRHIAKNMYFSSNELGNFFGMEIKQPFMNKEFINFSINKIPTTLKIKIVEGRVWGKWILRKTFEDLLPKEIIWQNKRPLEYGSGMTRLRGIITSRVDEDEFIETINSSSINFINKEHFYYYKIYKNVFGEIPKPVKGEKACLNCGGGMKKDSSHCRICGWTKPIR